MKRIFEIYIDRLKDGHIEVFHEELSPEIIELGDEELKFPRPIEMRGKAYIAQDELVVQLNITTTCSLPCIVCNEPLLFPIQIEDAYFAEPLKEIKGAVFDLGPWLRESILLESPAYVECGQGKCPLRGQMKNYIKKEKQSLLEGQMPFSHLKMQDLEVVEE